MACATDVERCVDARLTSRKLSDFGLSQEKKRLAGAYNTRQILVQNEELKQPQRERVMEHILRHHATDQKMRLLSMPGLRWPFERQIAEHHKPGIRYLAFEWNWGTIEMGTPWMPGTRPYRDEHELTIGNVKFVRTDDSAIWVWSHAGDFLTIDAKCHVNARRSQVWFSRKFCCNSAVWLDINTNLSSEARNCLRGLPSHLNPHIRRIPFAVTIIAGQEHDGLGDGSTTAERRVPLMVAELERYGLRRCEITDVWQYESNECCHMLNVCGLLHAT